MTQLNRVSVALAVLLLVGCSNPEETKQEAFARGNAFFDAGKYQEAIVEYRNALQQDERFGEARYKLAEALGRSGNTEQAFRQFVRAADVMPTNDEAQIRAASFLLLAGQFEDARTRITPVVERNPGNVNAQIILGNALAGLKDFDGAVREMEEAIKLEPGRAPTYSNLAALRLQQGDRAQAKVAFEKAVSVDPRSITAWLALAQFQWSTGDAKAAEQSLKRAIDIDPKHALANRALATYYVTSGRTAEAEPYVKVLAGTGGTASLQLADYYIGARRSADAKKVLEPLVADAAVRDDAETRLAAIAYSDNDKPRGHSLVDGVIQRDPNNVLALLLKAQFLVAENKLSEAAASAQRAVKAEPRSVLALFTLGTLQERLLQRKEAIASFNEVLRLNPRSAAAQLHLSSLTLLEGTPNAAVTFAEGALANAPGNPLARVSLIRGLLTRRELPRAEQELAGLMKQYPNVAVVHMLDGSLRLQKRDLAGARRSYERALSLVPASLEAFAGVVMLDLIENKVPQARARVDARLATEPNRPELMTLAARVYASQKDYGKAESVLRQAIQVNPNTQDAYALLAQVLVASGKLEAARVEFDQIAQRDQKNLAAKTMAAMIVHSQNKVADAKKRYEEIVNDNPAAAVAANNLAWIYAEEGDKLDEALRLAESAAVQLPENQSVQDTIGWIYYKKELPILAIPRFEKSIEKSPDTASYHYHLALALSKSGQRERALGAAEQALKLKPDYAEAQKLVASLKG